MRRTISTGLALALAAGSALAQQAARPNMATATMQAYAPVLGEYTTDVLFGDVWERPGLSKHDRSLVTTAALVALGRQGQLERHLARALDNGVKPGEIIGMVNTLAFYGGWPSASSALDAVDKVFRERRVDTASLKAAPAAPLALPASDAARVRLVNEQVAPVSAKLAEVTNKVLFDDLWRRSDLTPRERSLVVISAIVATGASDQLAFHLRRGMENGLTSAEIGEELNHLAFYAGWPKAMAAIGVAGKVFEAPAATSKPTASSEPLRVYRSTGKPVERPGSTFTGAVGITGPLALAQGSKFRTSIVTFAAGARTHWHSHPAGQLLVVTSGHGWIQAEGQPVRAIAAGDVIWTEPGVKHWHGATRNSAMSHNGIADSDESKAAVWADAVSDAEYHGPG